MNIKLIVSFLIISVVGIAVASPTAGQTKQNSPIKATSSNIVLENASVKTNQSTNADEVSTTENSLVKPEQEDSSKIVAGFKSPDEEDPFKKVERIMKEGAAPQRFYRLRKPKALDPYMTIVNGLISEIYFHFAVFWTKSIKFRVEPIARLIEKLNDAYKFRRKQKRVTDVHFDTDDPLDVTAFQILKSDDRVGDVCDSIYTKVEMLEQVFYDLRRKTKNLDKKVTDDDKPQKELPREKNLDKANSSETSEKEDDGVSDSNDDAAPEDEFVTETPLEKEYRLGFQDMVFRFAINLRPNPNLEQWRANILNANKELLALDQKINKNYPLLDSNFDLYLEEEEEV